MQPARPRAPRPEAASAADPGVRVPFEAPALRAARARADARHGLALLLRDFGAPASVYVLPWEAAPSVAPMSGRDLALHRAVLEESRAGGPMTPEAVRRATRRVAASGAAGDGAALAEAARAKAERASAGSCYAALLPRVLAGGAPLRPDLPPPDLLPPGLLLPGLLSGGEAAARAFAAAGARLGMSALALHDGLARAAHDLLPLGPLRQARSELGAFAERLAGQMRAARPEARPRYERVLDRLGDALTRADADIAAADSAIERLPALLPDWDGTRPWLADRIARVDLLFDVWAQALDEHARACARGEPPDRAVLLAAAALPPSAAARRPPG